MSCRYREQERPGNVVSMNLKRHHLFLLVLVSVAFALILHCGAMTTFAQCVMCRASLGNNSSFLRNFNIGVLVLLIPPVSMFCAIFIIAMRNRR